MPNDTQENEGGLAPIAGDHTVWSQGATALLQQITNLGGDVSNIQITVTLTRPVAEGAADSIPDVVMDTWIRQVLSDGRIAIRWLSGDPSQPIEEDVQPANPGEKTTWEELLGTPAVDIDTGVTLLRVAGDGESGVVSWLPNEPGVNPIHRPLSPKDAHLPPNPTAGLREFRICMAAKATLGLEPPAAISQCLSQLTS